MRPAHFDNPNYKKKQAEITRLNWQKDLYNFHLKKERRNCLNPYCKNSFIVPPSDKQKYCSHNCHNLVRRNYKIKTCPPCNTCGKLITQKGASKFCSLKCQSRNNYNQYIKRWKQGLESGIIGVRTKTLSGYISRYIRDKYGYKCSICGWDKRHPITNVAPLEIDHIDGNSNNNWEENLRLICPNCHALTPTFKNLNKGNGRSWRLKSTSTSSNRAEISI